mgnify:CR=1 FL=1|jgi:DnaJ-class molecular chaperone
MIKIIMTFNKAYDCLSNVNKRSTYDRYGDEKPEKHY